MAKDTSLTFSLYGKDVSATNSMKKVGKQSETLGQQFSKMGKVAAAGLAVAGAAAAKFAYDAVQAAADDQKSQKQLALALGNTTKATSKQIKASEGFISKLQLTYGIADDKLRPALATLARGTGSLAESQDLLGLAMNVSAGTGKDLTAVSMALVKAHNGNLGALKRLGVPLSDNIIKSKDFNKATKILSDTFGGAAKTNADTFSGKLAIMQQHLNESKEQIGVALLPVVQRFADYVLKTVVPNVQGFVDGLTGVKNKGGDATKSAHEFGEKVKGVIKWIGDHKDEVKNFAKAIAAIFAIRKTAGIIDSINTVIKALTSLKTASNTAAAAETSALGGPAALAIVAGGTVIYGAWKSRPGNPEQATAGAIAQGGDAAGAAWSQVGSAVNATLRSPSMIKKMTKLGYVWSDKEGWHKASKRAVGGSVMGRTSYYVGENGPELFTPSTSGRITPNGLGVGSGMNVVVNVHGSVVSEKDLAVSVRDNIAILMRRQGLNPNILGV